MNTKCVIYHQEQWKSFVKMCDIYTATTHICATQSHVKMTIHVLLVYVTREAQDSIDFSCLSHIAFCAILALTKDWKTKSKKLNTKPKPKLNLASLQDVYVTYRNSNYNQSLQLISYFTYSNTTYKKLLWFLPAFYCQILFHKPSVKYD